MVDQPERENTSDENAAGAVRRVRGQIEFPYADEERSVDLAQRLNAQAGSALISHDQLASAMNQSAAGGTYRGRLAAAKLFGFVRVEQGRVGLTDLGIRVSHPDDHRAAAVEAFLNVPLFRSMYEKYKGYALPPAAAIERQMVELGVPIKQKERARQTFQSSATYAGYIASNGRFIQPVVSSVGTISEAPPPVHDDRRGDPPGGGGGGNLPPFVQTLLDTLPEPGTDWSDPNRVTWLRAAAILFSLMYKGGGGDIEVRIKEKESPIKATP